MVNECYIIENLDDLKKKLYTDNFTPIENRVVRIHTSHLQSEEAMHYAKEVKKSIPNCHIVGCSTNGIIYKGKQYADKSLVVIEDYSDSTVTSGIILYKDKSTNQISDEIINLSKNQNDRFVHLLLGGFRDDTQTLIDTLKDKKPNLQVVGGNAGNYGIDLYESFVFNEEMATSEGCLALYLHSETATFYSSVNNPVFTAPEIYELTEVLDEQIISINHVPPAQWLLDVFHICSIEEFGILDKDKRNEVLLRIQLSLEGYEKSSRYLKVDSTLNHVFVLGPHLKTGTRFKLGYVSSKVCVLENFRISSEVAAVPAESIFCYSCECRKNVLQRSAEWEFTP